MFLQVDDDVFIVSGSKDSYIRIWKISLKRKIVVKGDELALEEQKFSVGQNGENLTPDF